MLNGCLGNLISMGVDNSTTPQPHSLLFLQGFKNNIYNHVLYFSAYPHMDITGKSPTVWDKINNNMINNAMPASDMDANYW